MSYMFFIWMINSKLLFFIVNQPDSHITNRPFGAASMAPRPKEAVSSWCCPSCCSYSAAEAAHKPPLFSMLNDVWFCQTILLSLCLNHCAFKNFNKKSFYSWLNINSFVCQPSKQNKNTLWFTKNAHDWEYCAFGVKFKNKVYLDCPLSQARFQSWRGLIQLSFFCS